MNSLFKEINLQSSKNYIHKDEYKDIITAVDNIPNMFEESKKNIIEKINIYIEKNL